MWDCISMSSYNTNSTMIRRNVMVACSNTTTVTTISSSVDSKYESMLTTTADIVVGCYLILLDLLAVILNGSVIGLSIWKRKMLKVSDAYVVWLAVSDLGHPILAYPMIIASSFRHAWLFGDIGCQWNGFTGFFFGVNSMMTLAIMSLSRLLIVTNSNFARNHSKSIACCLLTFTCMFALFWSLCPILGWGEYGPEPYKTSCTLVWHQPDKSFVTASFLGCLAVPVFIMSYSYFRILCIAIGTRRERLKWAPRSNEGRVWERKEMRLLKVTVIMCLSFLLCWTPYAIVAMLQAYASHLHLPVLLTALPAMAAKTSHVVDPLIYCGMNKNFSRYIPEIFKKSRSESEQVTVTMPLKSMIKELSKDESEV